MIVQSGYYRLDAWTHPVSALAIPADFGSHYFLWNLEFILINFVSANHFNPHHFCFACMFFNPELNQSIRQSWILLYSLNWVKLMIYVAFRCFYAIDLIRMLLPALSYDSSIVFLSTFIFMHFHQLLEFHLNSSINSAPRYICHRILIYLASQICTKCSCGTDP